MPLSKRPTRFARRVSRGRIAVKLLACPGGVARRGDVTSGSRRKSPCHGIRPRGIFPLSCLTLSSPPSCSSSCGSSGRTTTASGSWRIRLITSRSCATPFSASSPRSHLGDEAEKGVAHDRSEEHTSELQSRPHLVCRLLLDKHKRH